MKRALYLGLFLYSFVTTSWAGMNAATGFYFGGDFIFATYKPVNGAASESSWLPIAGYIRPFVGYRFSDFLAMEAGYSSLVNDSNNAHGDYGPDDYRLYALDVAAKLIYPFENGFSVFGKAGAALTYQNVYNQKYTNWEPSADTNSTRPLPLLGIGVSFNFTQQLAAELSYVHFQGVNSIGNIDLLGLGLSYTLPNTLFFAASVAAFHSDLIHVTLAGKFMED